MLAVFMRCREVIGRTEHSKAKVYDYRDERLRTLWKDRAEALEETPFAEAIEAMEICLGIVNPKA